MQHQQLHQQQQQEEPQNSDKWKADFQKLLLVFQISHLFWDEMNTSHWFSIANPEKQLRSLWLAVWLICWQIKNIVTFFDANIISIAFCEKKFYLFFDIALVILVFWFVLVWKPLWLILSFWQPWKNWLETIGLWFVFVVDENFAFWDLKTFSFV